ncbi:MAG: hypothetical protein JWP29_1969 [Rhodoferax sp.]|nr:hypothetical protein [Rhodoferax sp.]
MTRLVAAGMLALAALMGDPDVCDAANDTPQALHDVAWYSNNPAVRQKTISVCYSDASYAHLYDCQNAARGESLARSRRLWRQSNILDNPQWWQDNQIARRSAAAICARGNGPAYPQYAPYCSLIFAKEIEQRGA